MIERISARIARKWKHFLFVKDLKTLGMSLFSALTPKDVC